MPADLCVRYGSEADVSRLINNVRLVPGGDIRNCNNPARLNYERPPREPESEVQDHANNCSGDCRESRVQCGNTTQMFDERRADENPEEAGSKGDPGG